MQGMRACSFPTPSPLHMREEARGHAWVAASFRTFSLQPPPWERLVALGTMSRGGAGKGSAPAGAQWIQGFAMPDDASHLTFGSWGAGQPVPTSAEVPGGVCPNCHSCGPFMPAPTTDYIPMTFWTKRQLLEDPDLVALDLRVQAPTSGSLKKSGRLTWVHHGHGTAARANARRLKEQRGREKAEAARKRASAEAPRRPSSGSAFEEAAPVIEEPPSAEDSEPEGSPGAALEEHAHELLQTVFDDLAANDHTSAERGLQDLREVVMGETNLARSASEEANFEATGAALPREREERERSRSPTQPRRPGTLPRQIDMELAPPPPGHPMYIHTCGVDDVFRVLLALDLPFPDAVPLDVRALADPALAQPWRGCCGENGLILESVLTHARLHPLLRECWTRLHMQWRANQPLTLVLFCVRGLHRSVAFAKILGTGAATLGYSVHLRHHNEHMEQRRCNCRSRGSDADGLPFFCEAVARACSGESRVDREETARELHRIQARRADVALRRGCSISEAIAPCYNMLHPRA